MTTTKAEPDPKTPAEIKAQIVEARKIAALYRGVGFKWAMEKVLDGLADTIEQLQAEAKSNGTS